MKIQSRYFSHDINASSDRKILRMRKALGIESYGIYWMLIETLASEEDFSYPIADIDLLADRFGTSTEKVEAVVKQFHLFEIDQEAKFFSTSLINRMQKVIDISEKRRIAANTRWGKQKKLKAAEEEETPEPPPPPPPAEKINHLMDAIDTWNFFANEYGLSKVMKLTETRKAHIKKRLEEKEFNLIEILRKVERSQFLLGKKTEWRVDFDFIFASRNNYVKILEGKYDDKFYKAPSEEDKKLDIIRENILKDSKK